MSFTTKTLILGITALMLLGNTTATVLPAIKTPRDILPNLSVIIRGEDNTYAHSESMTETIRSDSILSFGLAKRSSAIVQACRTSSCTDCTTVWDRTFSSNSACIAAENTACLIISNLQDANIQFWNHAGCNGANTVYRGCGSGQAFRNAPGTNSLGVHTGC